MNIYDHIPDYNELYDEYERKQPTPHIDKSELLPKCDCCGKVITDEKLFDFDGTINCIECVMSCMKDTKNYI